MAKTTDKPNEKASKSEAGTKEKKSTTSDKNNGNNTTVAETTPVENKVTQPIVDKPVEKSPEPVVEKPFDIYDGESVKQVLPFPPTQQQTDTQRILTILYKIDATRLPQDIVNKINDYLTDFTAFIAAPDNQKDMSKIPIIMQKDKIASDAISAWLAPKKEYFEQQKLQQPGAISVTTPTGQPQNVTPQAPTQPQIPEGKIVVDKNNSQKIIDTLPSVPSALNNLNQPPHTVVTPNPYGAQAGQNPTPDYANFNQHQFIPRNPTTDAPAVGNAVHLPPAFGDNSRDVAVMMAQMATKHQGQNHTTMGAPIPNANFIDEYAKTIHQTITVGFSMYWLWGYIPIDSLKDILKNTEKSMSYEIVLNGDQSFVKISNGLKMVETAKFNCK